MAAAATRTSFRCQRAEPSTLRCNAVVPQISSFVSLIRSSKLEYGASDSRAVQCDLRVITDSRETLETLLLPANGGDDGVQSARRCATTGYVMAVAPDPGAGPSGVAARTQRHCPGRAPHVLTASRWRCRCSKSSEGDVRLPLLLCGLACARESAPQLPPPFELPLPPNAAPRRPGSGGPDSAPVRPERHRAALWQ